MSAGKAVYSRLTTDVTTAAALSTRIFPAQAEQNTAYPYVVIEEFDGERYSAMGEDLNIVRAQVRVNLWHDSYTAGHTVYAAILNALQRWRGTANTVVVDDIFVLPGSPVTYDDLLKAYNFQRDFEVIYRE